MAEVLFTGMIKEALRKVRVSQPLNFLATSTVRGVLDISGIRPEFVVRHLHRAGVTRCRLPNGRVLKLWSRGDDWVCTQIYWEDLSGYEPETVPVFLQLTTSARVIFDVGAYVGFYTVLAALTNPSAQVYAFEPHNECLRAPLAERANLFTPSDPNDFRGQSVAAGQNGASARA